MVNHPHRARSRDPNHHPIHDFTIQHRLALAGGREWRLSPAHPWQPVVEDQAFSTIKMTLYTLARAAGEYPEITFLENAQ